MFESPQELYMPRSLVQSSALMFKHAQLRKFQQIQEIKWHMNTWKSVVLVEILGLI